VSAYARPVRVGLLPLGQIMSLARQAAGAIRHSLGVLSHHCPLSEVIQQPFCDCPRLDCQPHDTLNILLWHALARIRSADSGKAALAGRLSPLCPGNVG
jgi:hypothetical protein